jgi:hypothetical protein
MSQCSGNNDYYPLHITSFCLCSEHIKGTGKMSTGIAKHPDFGVFTGKSLCYTGLIYAATE